MALVEARRAFTASSRRALDAEGRRAWRLAASHWLEAWRASERADDDALAAYAFDSYLACLDHLALTPSSAGAASPAATPAPK